VHERHRQSQILRKREKLSPTENESRAGVTFLVRKTFPEINIELSEKVKQKKRKERRGREVDGGAWGDARHPTAFISLLQGKQRSTIGDSGRRKGKGRLS